MDVDKRSTLPPALGGRGNLVGSYDQSLAVVLTVYGNGSLHWQAVEIRPDFCGECIFWIEAEADLALPIWFFSVRIRQAVG